MNPMPEYTASSIPIVNGEAPNRSAYNGSTGMTMPKPTISMKTVKSKIAAAIRACCQIFVNGWTSFKEAGGLQYAPSSWNN